MDAHILEVPLSGREVVVRQRPDQQPTPKSDALKDCREPKQGFPFQGYTGEGRGLHGDKKTAIKGPERNGVPFSQNPSPNGGRERNEQGRYGCGEHDLSELRHVQVIGEDKDQGRDCHEIARACHEHPSQIAAIERVGSKNLP